MFFSAALSKLKGTFQWRTWNEDNIRLKSIEIETLPDGGFHLRQQKFVDQLELTSLRGSETKLVLISV